MLVSKDVRCSSKILTIIEIVLELSIVDTEALDRPFAATTGKYRKKENHYKLKNQTIFRDKEERSRIKVLLD